jgi:hypothetical protein
LVEDDYAAVRAIAQRSRRPHPAGAAPLSPELVSELMASRDRRPVTIAE